jgi:hypothetical protein
VNAMGKQGDQNLITQDLLFGVGATANEGDVVSVRYIAFPLTVCKLGEVSMSVALQLITLCFVNLYN